MRNFDVESMSFHAYFQLLTVKSTILCDLLRTHNPDLDENNYCDINAAVKTWIFIPPILALTYSVSYLEYR